MQRCKYLYMPEMPAESKIYFSAIASALAYWVPTEYDRKWSAVLSEGILHANSRCEEVGGEDAWKLRKGDKLTSITLREMEEANNHCLACIRSYLEGGFIYNWFGKCYNSVIKINNAFLRRDSFEVMYEFYAFSYTDNLRFKDEVIIYDKLVSLGILKPFFGKASCYQYIKKGEVPRESPIDFSISHSLDNGFYLHPIIENNPIPYGVELPAPDNELSKVLEVFEVLLRESKNRYGYAEVEELWNIADKV